jgi:predicted DNA-binding protein (UPF0251 family)
MTTELLEVHVAGERITREQAAEQLGVSLATLDRYLAAGLLTREKNRFTKRVTLDADEVERLRLEREDH